MGLTPIEGLQDHGCMEVTHLSNSQLGTLLACAHRWLLQKHHKAKEISAWWNVGGSSVHTLTEEWEREYERERGNG